jgi:hypothetical protein
MRSVNVDYSYLSRRKLSLTVVPYSPVSVPSLQELSSQVEQLKVVGKRNTEHGTLELGFLFYFKCPLEWSVLH